MPGIMQSLLLQGAVPVTMIFSLFMLRPGGCSVCRRAKTQLSKAGIKYTVCGGVLSYILLIRIFYSA